MLSRIGSMGAEAILDEAKEIRQRLSTNLDKLSKLRSTDLIREDTLGPQLSFRAGIPFFERTLTLYRQIAHTNLSRTPSAILEIAANHAEESLHQFEQIQAFTPAGIDRPEQIRNLLINDVRDAHPAIYDDLCILLAPTRAQMEKAPRGPGRMLTMMVLAVVLIVAILGYRSSLFGSLIYNLKSHVDNFLAH
jgi:hypothetical protein